jgi:hypothetical protein
MYYLVCEDFSNEKFMGMLSDKIVKFKNVQAGLYAYTPDPISASIFEDMRDMKKFYTKIVNMSYEDYDVFCDESPDQLLEYHFFGTNMIKNGKYVKESVSILCTLTESDSVLMYKEELVSAILESITPQYIIDHFNVNTLKKKYRKALKHTLMYDELFEESVHPVEDLSFTHIDVDDLAVFVRVFKNTLRKEIKA